MSWLNESNEISIKIKIYAVISTAYVARGCFSVPQIHYFSMNRLLCEKYIKEREEACPLNKNHWIIEELESEQDLGYLCGSVKY